MLAHLLRNTNPYKHVARITLADILEYRVDNAIRIGRYVLTVAFALLLWIAIGNESTITQINIPELIGYYVAAMIIYGTSNYHLDYIESDIRLGYMSKYMVKPISAYWYYFTHQGTIALYDILVKSILFLPFFLFSGSFLLSSIQWPNVTLVVLLLAATYFTTFSLFFSFSTLAFWFQQVDSLRLTLLFVGRYLSGILIPFFFFPDWAQKILWWTPFPHFAYTPISLLQDRLTTIEAAQGLLILICWGVLFYVVQWLIWKQATHAYEGTGL